EICETRLPGAVSAQSNTSAAPFSTDSAFALTFEEILVSTVTCPAGPPGIAWAAQCGLMLVSNETFGTTFWITYGPSPGGGLFGMFFIGVPDGTRPCAGNASTFENAPYGANRWITIWPVASFAVMPEIVFALPL